MICQKNDCKIEDNNILGHRGFVTIATGNKKYYQLAVNLLRSYRVNGDSSLPFAIICDKDCDEAREFDNMVLINNPNNSYLDKLSLYKYAPYEETVFIDADSLVLAPVCNIWEDFKHMGDFSCYGKVLPLDSRKGWFFYEGMGELKDKLTFCVNMHGGLYYLRKTSVCEKVFNDAIDFAKNYHAYAFAQFQNPADEPVLALSMTLANCKPCDRQDRILFFPSVDGKLHVDSGGILRLKRKICKVPVLHFANINVRRYLYQYLLLHITYKYEDIKGYPGIKDQWKLRIKCFFSEIKSLVRRLLKKILPKKFVVLLKRIIDKKLKKGFKLS